MISSMTAFARESAVTEQGILTVELRSVNHRYLDCTFKLPDVIRQIEPRLRELARGGLTRGKLDCLVRLQPAPGKAAAIVMDDERLEQVLQATATISHKLGKTRNPTALEVLEFPGVCIAAQSSDDELLAACEAQFTTAMATLQAHRQREGSKLQAMIEERLQLVSAEVSSTRAIVPQLISNQRDKLLTRINDLDVEVDNNRLEQELVYMAQKADVAEELDRLESHVDEVARTLDKGGPCGRRLDFLMQELNREANTLSSKSIASGTTLNAVELKVLIEQMREQVQNIE